MGVYIDMEMPKDGFVEILVRADGTVQQTGQTLRLAGDYFYTAYVGERPPMYKAIPVPPHGDLIDRDVLLKKCEFACTDDDEDVRVVRYSAIESAPTIIPAEQSEKEVDEAK